MNSNGMTVSGRQTPPLGLVVFQFYGKVGTEKTKSQGGIFMHMADALVTPAVAGTIYACSAAVAAYSKPVGGQTPVKTGQNRSGHD